MVAKGGETDYADFTVVIPTINEQDNIGIIITKLLDNYNGISIVVADDGSTDGTKERVRLISKAHGSVYFLDRKALGRRSGLTASVIDGIKHSKTRFVIVMDADMQHPYQSVREIARMLKCGNRLVIAVRQKTKNWSIHRRLISKMFLGVGYLVLVIRSKQSCNDVSSGFFGIERSLFLDTYGKNTRRYVSEGIRVLFDTLKCIERGSVPMAEVPYTLFIRTRNVSKVGLGQGMKAIKSFFT